LCPKANSYDDMLEVVMVIMMQVVMVMLLQVVMVMLVQVVLLVLVIVAADGGVDDGDGDVFGGDDDE